MQKMFLLTCLSMSSLFIVPDCNHDDGDCNIHAFYDAEFNRTIWTAACNDGYVGGGISGGNLIPGICGA